KTQALLGYLAMTPGPHPRGKLAALLWGSVSEERARDSLRHALAALRQTLPKTPSPLLLEADTVAVNQAAVEVDVAVFKRYATEATPRALAQAAACYRGDLLDGLSVNEISFEEWVRAERERLQELALQALARLLAHQIKAREIDQAIHSALRLLALDPLQERVHRALMRLHLRAGRRGSALKQYQTCVSVLQRELSTEPEAETRELYQAILRRRASGSVEMGMSARPHPTMPPETPLIGRTPELARLRLALEDTIHGQGRIVAMTGEAGIGKSRLLQALAGEAQHRRARILLGRAHQTEQVLAFGPWVDALRAAHVDDAVIGLDPVWRAELARLLPEVHSAGGPSPGDDSLRLFESVAHLIGKLAGAGAVVVMLEDLHWADEMTLRLVAFLARRITALRVLLVVTARDDELAASPALPNVLDELPREPHFVPLALAPLSRPQTADLVRALADRGPAAGARADPTEEVWRLSEGNPFVVVETIRALQEGAVPHTPTGLPLPERVRQMIRARLERLDSRSRDLVAVASVIGREFDFALLARAAECGEAEAAGAVEDLVRRRLLHGTGEHFDFAHERIREVVYAELLQPRRRLLHARVGEALETLHASDLAPHYVALGSHFREAEIWDRAATYLRRAGAQAIARSANREAATCLAQALGALQHLPPSRELVEHGIDVRFDLRDALFPLGEAERILEYLREAQALAESLGDQRRLGWAVTYISNSFWRIGDHTHALDAAQQAAAIAARVEDCRLRAAIDIRLGQIHYALGHYRRAADLLGKSVAALEREPVNERFGLPGLPAVFSRAFLAKSLAELGEFAEARARGEEAVRLAETVGHPLSIAIGDFAGGLVCIRQGDLKRAQALLERGHGLCQAADMPVVLIQVAGTLGHAYALAGHVETGLRLLTQAVEHAVGIRFMYLHALIVSWLAEAHLQIGRVTDARTLAERALAIARDQRERGHEAWARRLLGAIAAHAEPAAIAESEAAYRQALDLATELGMRPLAAHCHLGLGTLYHRARRPGAARQELATAADLFHATQMIAWLPRATEVAAL
ncbi:MAG: ATP-binding protein, partial [Candidatus Rokuibacteriota bacterium]